MSKWFFGSNYFAQLGSAILCEHNMVPLHRGSTYLVCVEGIEKVKRPCDRFHEGSTLEVSERNPPYKNTPSGTYV